MRRLAYLLVLAAGCGDATPTLRFAVDKDIPQQTINGSLSPCQIPITVPLLSQPFDVTFSEEEDFPEQNTDIQHIKSAKLAGLTLTLTSGEPNWDFINLLRIYADADGLERSLVASVDPAPDGVTTLTLTSAGLELAPYVKANGGFTLTSEAEGCPPSQNTTFVGEVRINVTATPL